MKLRVAARRVDHHEVGAQYGGLERRLEARPLIRLVARGGDRSMARHRQLKPLALGKGGTVLDVAREGALPGVEIDRGDPAAVVQQRHDDMHGGGRLARAALLVADHQHVRPPRRAHRLRLDDAGVGSRPERGH
jgi:hypothetical protein